MTLEDDVWHYAVLISKVRCALDCLESDAETLN